MYVPASPAQAAPALAPVPVITAAQVSFAPRLHTSLVLHRSQLNVLEGQTAGISGELLEGRRAGQAGRPVKLQEHAGRGWATVAATRTRAGGRFHLSFSPQRLGSEAVRVSFAGDGAAFSSARGAGSLNVYRLAEASWYGGGGTMACGGELSSSTLGVANKTLPCGTIVTLRYGSRTIRVPVVDRGPYVAGREFDLTEATKQALGFAGVGEVWSTS
jgi:hypothetical protein